MGSARAFDTLIVGRVGGVADFDSYRVGIDAQQLGDDLAMHGVSANSLVAHAAQKAKHSVTLQNQFETRIAVTHVAVTQRHAPSRLDGLRCFRRSVLSPGRYLRHTLEHF